VFCRDIVAIYNGEPGTHLRGDTFVKASDIRTHFLSGADWLSPGVDIDSTEDEILVGDPHKDVQSILVTWMCDYSAVAWNRAMT